MRYCPPFIFAHRCFLERGENAPRNDTIASHFGEGGHMPYPDSRWTRTTLGISELMKMGIDKDCHGEYIGFRTRDDQMLFYMLFEGKL
jgi:hypothetical protein